VKLNYGLSDVVINWAGGLHHAKKSEVGLPSFPSRILSSSMSYEPSSCSCSNGTLLQLHTHPDERLGWLQSVGLNTLLCFAPSTE
jgi:hypothetical protein